jgi:hypothetical protein
MTVRRVLSEARDAAAVGVIRLGVGVRLRAAILGGMALAVVASFGAGGTAPWIVPVLFIAGALLTAAKPDTHFGFGALLAFGYFWLVHVDAATTLWSVPAAAGLLLFHLATSALALGPAEAELPRALLASWARRCLPVLAGTVALWLVTALLRRADTAANVVLTAAALVIVAAGGWLALARSSSDAPSSGSTP